MILNDTQLENTKEVLNNLKTSLSEVQRNSEDKAFLKEIATNGYQSLISEIEAEIREYTSLKSGHIDVEKSEEFNTETNLLIKARIFLGITQNDLAKKIGLSLSEIQVLEESNYFKADCELLAKVASVLTKSMAKGSKLHSRLKRHFPADEKKLSIKWLKTDIGGGVHHP